MRIIFLLILWFSFASATMAQTSTKQKKHIHHSTKTIIHRNKHKDRNYYNPSKVLKHNNIIDRKINHDKIPKSSVTCVAETIYSESRGEPLAGQIAVGSTIITRTNLLHKDPCNVTRGQYTQKRIPFKDKDEFYILASNVLDGKTKSPIDNMDSFDSFKHKRHPKGSVHIGKHFFYKALKS